jgi:hypothetical protein
MAISEAPEIRLLEIQVSVVDGGGLDIKLSIIY